MEEVKTKVCPKCGEEKPLTGEFWYFRKDRKQFWHICRLCMYLYNQDYLISNPTQMDKVKFIKTQYYHKNKEIVTNRAKTWKKNNKDKDNKEAARRTKQYCDELRDSYIRKCLRQTIEKEHITPELIEIKRQLIIGHRLLKQFTKEGLSDEFSSAEVNGNQRDVGEVQEKRGYSGGGTGVCLTC